MKKILVAISLTIAIHAASAQSKLDSLYAIWEDESAEDSARAQAFSSYIWDGFLFVKPDSAFILAGELVQYGNDNQNLYAKTKGYNLQAVSFSVRGEIQKAITYNEKGLACWQKAEDKDGVASSYNNLALDYASLGEYAKALEFHERSLNIFKELGYEGSIGASLGSIGNIYLEIGNYSEALRYQQQSLKVCEETGERLGEKGALASIGLIYKAQGNNQKALEYYKRSLVIAEELNDKRGISTLFGNMASAYSAIDSTEKSLDYYIRGLTIKEEIGDKKGVAYALTNIGFYYLDKDSLAKARKNQESALEMLKEIEDLNGISHSFYFAGLISNEQGLYKQASKECLKALGIAEEIGSLERQINACDCLYKAYKGSGNQTKALFYYEQFQNAKDSINAKETDQRLQQMEFKKAILLDSIATEEEKRQLQALHQEEVRQKNQIRNVLLAIGILILIFAGGIYSRLRYVRRSKAALQTEKDRSENLLLNILPADIATELKEKGRADARNFEKVSVLFTDFKGFTEQSAKMSAADLVGEINVCFEAFDGIMAKYGVEKIKTIGDAYMSAGGLPVPTNDSVKNTVLAALEMQQFIAARSEQQKAKSLPFFEMRVGIHTGPVVAGIVGVKKFQYDIWGDTVNTASRMESAGEVGKVNISQATYELLTDTDASAPLSVHNMFTFESRGKIEAKGKGEMEMWFVTLKN